MLQLPFCSSDRALNPQPEAVCHELSARRPSAPDHRPQPFQTVRVDLGPQVWRQADGSLHEPLGIWLRRATAGLRFCAHGSQV